MKFDIITVGGITEDIMFYVDDLLVLNNPKSHHNRKLLAFPAGDKIISDSAVLYTGGGGGANTAVSFARLGLKTALIGAMGADYTAEVSFKRLSQEGVNTSLIQQYHNNWSGLSLVVSAKNKNDHVIFTHRAANEKLKISTAALKNIQAKGIYLSSLSGPAWQNNISELFNWATKTKLKIAWNPGAVQLATGLRSLKKYLQLTELLIVNKDEAIELALSIGIKKTDIVSLLKLLIASGPKLVSITDGAKGAWLADGVRNYYQPALKVKVKNSTGAGDAFGSSLFGGLLIYRGDYKQALKLALIRSCTVVTKVGAQTGLLTLKEAAKGLK